ncbi:single-stranded DNA-binding protein [Pontibacillus halophilus JSM 076056 = DSM 19796]|uniref:Single-stranded-DNA-specific exonuclease RecJ n=1 Tax=Pontibacillus halophilus JSM 076056 = DSM 19796 TaxID=1385510 RepID=A0A0A5GNK0_9BACI|nr:single-stranded-DNA-specific exonuclease RecJ [Pontibacillus halophilus]KGX93514.1 single-stranded DNA-binding protein [Pontibacillus halophilus JSM 076056 = DSM 19796]
MLRSKAKWDVSALSEPSVTIDDSLSVSTLTQRLLRQRGIHTKEAALEFLTPDLDKLHDPMLFDDMQKSVDRVRQAVQNDERVLVFGDYDADGVSATTVMVEALREVGATVDYYIPNRFTEGYGPNEAAFRKAKEAGVSLIITVDTGIAAVHEAAVAKELDIDLIITDHHEVQEQLPDAYALLHPKHSSHYPFPELAGVGVAFKFAHALLEEFPKHLLDLVVIGTIADLVPLHGENRILAYCGLKAITRSIRPGIVALKNICGIEGTMTEEDIGFMIGPRINAVGRLQDASPAVQLMLTEDDEEAVALAEMIQQLNQQRQKVVADISKEAEAMIEADESKLSSVLVVGKEGWNPGVLGIVASKLVQKYDRPAIVLAFDPDKGTAKGSARSIDAFDLFVNCMEVRHLFTHFGGHSQAAGMTLPLEQVDLLRSSLSQMADDKLAPEDFSQLLAIDGKVSLDEITLEKIHEINSLAPFGMGNPKPLFMLEKEVPREMRQIGSQLNHLKLQFKAEGAPIDAVGFGLGELYNQIAPQSSVSIVGELSVNEWNGRKKPQVMMKDLRVDDWQLFDLRGNRHAKKFFDQLAVKDGLAIAFDRTNTVHSTFDGFKLQFVDEERLHELPEGVIEHVVFLDLPNSLELMSNVLHRLRPRNVYTAYRVHDAAFLKTLPTREHFKWFYGMVRKHESFHLERDSGKLASYKGWTKETVEFIAQVFFELGFVKIENGLLTLNPNPVKKDLAESQQYQQKLNQLQVEQTLYFSSYQQLKVWMDEQMDTVVNVKEEVTNGL